VKGIISLPHLLGSVDGITLAQHRHAHLLAGTLGQRDSRTQLLVVVFGVDVQPDVRD
jgi:hypothetical protein